MAFSLGDLSPKMQKQRLGGYSAFSTKSSLARKTPSKNHCAHDLDYPARDYPDKDYQAKDYLQKSPHDITLKKQK